jgi:hypothetical protein
MEYMEKQRLDQITSYRLISDKIIHISVLLIIQIFSLSLTTTMTTMTSTDFGLIFEPMPVPEELHFRLPDETPVLSKLVDGPTSSQDTATKVPRTLPIAILVSGKPLLTFKQTERRLRVSPYGVVNDDRAVTDAVLSVQVDSASGTISTREFWAAIYGLWLRRTQDDVLPIELSGLGDIYDYLGMLKPFELFSNRMLKSLTTLSAYWSGNACN